MEPARTEENSTSEHVEDIAPLLGLPEVYSFYRPKPAAPTAVSRWQEIRPSRCPHCSAQSGQPRESDTSSTAQTSNQVTIKGKEPIRQCGSEQPRNEETNVVHKGRGVRLLQTFRRLNVMQSCTERSGAQHPLKSWGSSSGKVAEATKEQEQESTQRKKPGWLSTWDTLAVALSHGAMMPV